MKQYSSPKAEMVKLNLEEEINGVDQGSEALSSDRDVVKD